MKKLAIVAAIATTLLTACTTSSTGRSQLMLNSKSEVDAMGATSFDQLKQKEKINTDSKLNKYVSCVSSSIVEFVPSNVHSGTWEVVVFESEQVNAFALPGGKIGIYTGILSVTENKDQLAAIIGHEVAHVIEQHSNERLSSNQVAQTGMAITAAALATTDIEHKGALVAALGVGIQYGVIMPYSRSHETEADIVGQNLMAQAGFKPAESVELWKNMAKQSGGAPPEFLSTHPSNTTRIKNLSKNLKKSQPIFQQSAKNTCVKPS